MLKGIYRDIERLVAFSESDVKRVPTGIREVDNAIRGPAPGEICMIMGRSYSGKSIIGQNIVHYNRHLPSIFFSLEMPAMQALIRLYAMWSDTSAADVQQYVEEGSLPEDVWDMVFSYPKHQIIDESGITMQGMSEALLSYEGEFGERPAFVVIDYLELVGGAKASGEGYIATEMQATMLKDWAREEDMRVFVLHQTNRQEKQYMPPTEDSARNAGFTEADFVIGLWRPHKDPKMEFTERLSKKNLIAANVLKNRAFFNEKDLVNIKVTPSLRVWREGESGPITPDKQAAESSGEVRIVDTQPE